VRDHSLKSSTVPLPTDLFDYDLPPRLIAQTPVDRRDASRLLVVHRASGLLEHRQFSELGAYLKTGDVLFRNNVSVLPARLRAERPTGGLIECFLLRPTTDSNTWWCLTRPGKKLPVGATFTHAPAFGGVVLDKRNDGTSLVRFTTSGSESIADVANRLGEIPLPPYIEREGTALERARDLARYQTVYADGTKQVAVAAPTAGLHFTPELLASLTQAGVLTADLTLHVGLGTFRPITTATIGDHDIHRETYEIPVETQQRLVDPTLRRIAVGTTTVRSIEDFLGRQAIPLDHPFVGEASIFLYPPATFRGVDALITNFHQPRSTLLCLVAAFLTPGSTDGIARLRAIYAEAIARDYRFFSYGDAMLIL
jgi:S-adenosylmethionine:tRNA ribosyltransferase-isomerase